VFDDCDRPPLTPCMLLQLTMTYTMTYTMTQGMTLMTVT